MDGIFCPNESTTFGMLLALRKAGLAGKMKLVGFDASEKLVKGLRDGDIDALVVQDPFKMGDLAVRAMVDHLHGQPPAGAHRHGRARGDQGRPGQTRRSRSCSTPT